MKYAFSTVACPGWDFETIASRAKEYGYDGVEIRGFLNESVLTASNPFLTDPKKLAGLFKYHGVEVCCLASSIAMTHKKRRDAVMADDCRRFIDAAAEIGCPIVKIFDTQVKPGHSRASMGNVFGDWLMPLGDYAADRDITIAVENALSFRASKEMWAILDRLSHPSIGCCWDIFNAALIGEGPSVSVPTLNSRIVYTQVKDAKLGPLGANFCKLGEGDVAVEKFLIRLLGIGYEGYVTMEWEKAWLPGLAEPEEILPDSIKKLRAWGKSNDEATEADSEPAAPAKPAKPAAAGAH